MSKTATPSGPSLDEWLAEVEQFTNLVRDLGAADEPARWRLQREVLQDRWRRLRDLPPPWASDRPRRSPPSFDPTDISELLITARAPQIEQHHIEDHEAFACFDAAFRAKTIASWNGRSWLIVSIGYGGGTSPAGRYEQRAALASEVVPLEGYTQSPPPWRQQRWGAIHPAYGLIGRVEEHVGQSWVQTHRQLIVNGPKTLLGPIAASPPKQRPAPEPVVARRDPPPPTAPAPGPEQMTFDLGD